ncbi:MAG: hypothetical protein JWP38_1040 [Herbaspirillum sp.]|nr:hypothetical protein [Herbaspirillum sp.]
MKTKYFMALLLSVASFSASAAASIGNAKVTDFTLNGQAADGIAFSTGNGQSGPNGNPSVFNNVFTGSWNLLTEIGSNGQVSSTPLNIAGSGFDVTFSLAPNQKTGVWSITATQSMTLDLVLGMHAGNATVSFLFNDEQLTAGQTETGTFNIGWFNGGSNIPAYSNLTMFYKDAVLTPGVSPVPEAGTWAMMLAGLGFLGFAARRKNAKIRQDDLGGSQVI